MRSELQAKDFLAALDNIQASSASLWLQLGRVSSSCCNHSTLLANASVPLNP